MASSTEILAELVAMSRRLGDPARDYAILGEGNTSAGVDEESFFVKASGACLDGISEDGFVRVRRAPVLAMLDAEQLSDEAVRDGMLEARVNRALAARPSVETLFHAYLLSLPGVNFVGHTHPTPVNALLCSQKAEEAIRGRLFPDEIVCCGVAPAWVPYTDPGQPLARAIRTAVENYLDEQQVPPRIILMQNHGLIALGNSPGDVESATAMYAKTARILLGAYALGGPHFLEERHVQRIYTRPDEKYRQERIGEGPGGSRQ
jgi:rhamnose utilization protein RhaD (predicted bifunctional aldolase and dehydrogenase)